VRETERLLLAERGCGEASTEDVSTAHRGLDDAKRVDSDVIICPYRHLIVIKGVMVVGTCCA